MSLNFPEIHKKKTFAISTNKKKGFFHPSSSSTNSKPAFMTSSYCSLKDCCLKKIGIFWRAEKKQDVYNGNMTIQSCLLPAFPNYPKPRTSYTLCCPTKISIPPLIEGFCLNSTPLSLWKFQFFNVHTVL